MLLKVGRGAMSSSAVMVLAPMPLDEQAFKTCKHIGVVSRFGIRPSPAPHSIMNINFLLKRKYGPGLGKLSNTGKH